MIEKTYDITKFCEHGSSGWDSSPIVMTEKKNVFQSSMLQTPFVCINVGSVHAFDRHPWNEKSHRYSPGIFNKTGMKPL